MSKLFIFDYRNYYDFKYKKNIFKQLLDIYSNLLDIEWNIENIVNIQSLNFQFKNTLNEYDTPNKYSIIVIKNIVELKRIYGGNENFKKLKAQVLTSLSHILFEENRLNKYNIEIRSYVNPDVFDFTKKEDVLRYLKENFEPFKSKYSDTTFRAKLIYVESIYKNVLIIEGVNKEIVNESFELVREPSELISIKKLRDSDFKKTEKILIL